MTATASTADLVERLTATAETRAKATAQDFPGNILQVVADISHSDARLLHEAAAALTASDAARAKAEAERDAMVARVVKPLPEFRVGSADYYEMLDQFEKHYQKEFRLDREDKSLWAKGFVYQHGELHHRFHAFQRGVAFMRSICTALTPEPAAQPETPSGGERDLNGWLSWIGDLSFLVDCHDDLEQLQYFLWVLSGRKKARDALVGIVEGIQGAMEHGTWRDEKGMRLKDTPEWVAFYVAAKATPPEPAAQVGEVR